jgi:RHS repeat-associated protein
MVQAASYPPLQKTQGRGTHCSGTGRENKESRATRLYDFQFRKYNNVAGRWIRPDPAGLGAVNFGNPQTFNRYAYTLNNPLRAVDPLGLDLMECDPDVEDCGGGGGGGGDPCADGSCDPNPPTDPCADGSCDPNPPTDPGTNPTDPNNPPDPSNPTDPTDPNNPDNPGQDPTNPSDPSDPQDQGCGDSGSGGGFTLTDPIANPDARLGIFNYGAFGLGRHRARPNGSPGSGGQNSSSSSSSGQQNSCSQQQRPPPAANAQPPAAPSSTCRWSTTIAVGTGIWAAGWGLRSAYVAATGQEEIAAPMAVAAGTFGLVSAVSAGVAWATCP